MNQAQAEQEIRRRIAVTPQMVVLAKAVVFEGAKTTTRSAGLVDLVLSANGAALPQQVVLHSSVDASAAVLAVASALSWQMAAKEAIWSLIHGGLLLPLSETITGGSVSVGWTTVVPGSGGESAGWRFDDTEILIPHMVRRAPSAGASGQFLSDPDLYLHSLGVGNMHQDVRQAFTEAVKCFRVELFTAALTMLGKASEGSWLELGRALVARTPAAEARRFAKQQATLEDSNAGTMRKVEAVIAMYEHHDLFKDLVQASEVRAQRLKEVAVWSDAVRDSRNTIHFGVEAALPNTYEKLAALLIGAVPNVRTLYRVKAAAEAST